MLKIAVCLSAPAAVIAAGVFACFSAVGVAAEAAPTKTESTVGAASAATAKPTETESTVGAASAATAKPTETESTVGAASAATAKPTEQIVVVAHKDERSVREIAANVTVLSRADLNDER